MESLGIPKTSLGAPKARARAGAIIRTPVASRRPRRRKPRAPFADLRELPDHLLRDIGLVRETHARVHPFFRYL